MPTITNAIDSRRSAQSGQAVAERFELNSELFDRMAKLPLNESQRGEILAWLDDLRKLHHAPNKGQVVLAIADARAVSPSTVNNKYAAVKKRGPLALIDKRTRASRPSGVDGFVASNPDDPAAFQKFVGDLYRSNNRFHSSVEVYERLLTRWEDWRKTPTDESLRIPGFDWPPAPSRVAGERHPEGWSLRNIQRMRPNGYDLALSRMGRKGADQHLPRVYTSRIGTRVGEIVMIDDQEYDIQVHHRGKITRPLGLNLLDLHSGCDVLRYYRPALPDGPQGGKSITERETWWLIVDYLSRFGYLPTGTEVVGEGGTATVRDAQKKILEAATDGAVTFWSGGITGDALRGFPGPRRGNPRAKAARESWFNLFRNRFGSLPGQTGKDPESAPAELAAGKNSSLVRYHQRLLDEAAESLDIGLIMQLKLELLPWSRFVSLADQVSEQINRRQRHALEGWEALGYEAIEYRLPGGEWISENDYLALPSRELRQLTEAMAGGELVTRPVRFSPRQVFESGRGDLRTLGPEKWHLLMPKKWAIGPKKIPRDRQVRFTDKLIDLRELIFEPRCIALDGTRQVLPKPGTQVLIYCNPWRPDSALFTHLDGSPIGVVARVLPQHRHDEEALIRQFAEKAAVHGQIGTDAVEHAREIAQSREKMVADNDAVFETARRRIDTAADARRAARARLADGLGDAATAPPEPIAEIQHVPTPDPETEIETGEDWI